MWRSSSTLIAIFTEQLHGFERPRVAARGAIAMIVPGQLFDFYSTEAAVEAPLEIELQELLKQ
ncbi:MAG: hypothetical protein OXH37_11945 [Gammaproteobacteria bacterium]|nr:hypothetical protein [Gammaproteobacteria bacterium]MDD9998813.1 hypothetical protein [Rhodospirillaceae bacterium]MDE0359654.1 hypothetical protein [Rhodospirillaceae bacterium]